MTSAARPSLASLTAFLAAAVLLVAGCERRAAVPASGPAAPAGEGAAASVDARDIHSYARPLEARVTHVALDLTADFETRRLRGTATLSIERAADARQIVLDTMDLTIAAVTNGAGAALEHRSGVRDAILGTPLTVDLPPAVREVVIRYETSPQAAALQWLSPAQTAGRRQPYLFSQGQAILTRTWMPTQDSPGVRQTWQASITVPQALRAVMSGERHGPPEGRPAAHGRTFEYVMRHPVAPYLIALAVGDIDFRAIGARTGVYAEPSVVEAAAREFADLEKMVEAAEALYGPYRWGRYDLLVLPPSFPFGGMENPTLTFLTPTVIAGDRSLVSLVAHELAHSWSGNLVTNATWSDFWLNEGFTTYFENRIMERLYGADLAAMLQQLERRDLDAEIEGFGERTGESMLHIDLAGRNPDDGMTDVPYNKGAALLRTIERAVGRERFDAHLHGYFDRHAFQSMTTAAFLEDLRANLIRGDAALEQQLRLDEWVYRPGIPSNYPAASSERFAQAAAQARAFAAGTAPASLVTQGWVTQEWQHFIGALPEKMTPAQMAVLDARFAFTKSGNGEILFEWLRKCIASRYEPAMPALERFLTSQGRRKFVLPLYRDLMEQDWGEPVARRIYAQARPTYHAVTTRSVDDVVKR